MTVAPPDLTDAPAATLPRDLPTILDLEASGFGRGSYPIEVGFVQAQGVPFCSLIQPAPDWSHWDESAEALHGISRECLARHGRPREWVAREINARLAGQTVYSDSWAYDYSWLSKLFDSVDMQPRFKLDDLRRLLNEDEARRFGALKQRIRDEAQLRRHRASADARLLQLTLMRVRQPEAPDAPPSVPLPGQASA